MKERARLKDTHSLTNTCTYRDCNLSFLVNNLMDKQKQTSIDFRVTLSFVSVFFLSQPAQVISNINFNNSPIKNFT